MFAGDRSTGGSSVFDSSDEFELTDDDLDDGSA